MQIEDFLEIEIPQDAIEVVKRFTWILARGALEGFWDSNITRDPINGRIWFPSGKNQAIRDEIARKWGARLPQIGVFVSLGYLTPWDRDDYQLTQRAFTLLDDPPAASIFISYRRDESSAFALLVLARLKAVLGEVPFLDIRDIFPGDDWLAVLENEIKKRDNFICLVGPNTLDSETVMKEIEWALESGSRTIPIWHNGFDIDKEAKYPEHIENFLRRNAIIVENNHPKANHAKAYDNAIRDLLIYFGITSI